MIWNLIALVLVFILVIHFWRDYMSKGDLRIKCKGCGQKFLITKGNEKMLAKKFKRCQVTACPQKDLVEPLRGKQVDKDPRVDKQDEEYVDPPPVHEVQSGKMVYGRKSNSHATTT